MRKDLPKRGILQKVSLLNQEAVNSAVNADYNPIKYMKKFLVLSLGSLLALAIGNGVARAQVFEINLSADQEPGTVKGTGTGHGFVTLAQDKLTFSDFSFSGLSGTLVSAHFHGPGAVGKNAGVLYDLLTLTTAGQKAGTFSGVVSLIDKPNNTTFSIAQQVDQLTGGQWYMNLHTSPTFSGGEIRGQLLAVSVPEPSTMALAGLGLGALLVWRRRSQA